MPVRSPMSKQAKFLATLSRTGRVGVAAKAADITANTAREWRKDFPEFDQAWAAATQTWKESLADEGLQAVREIIADESHKDRFSAAKWATERVEGPIAATQRVELSGPDAGPMEVNHPDVAAAINAFTQRVIAATTGGRTELAHAAASGPGESPARIPVAELDRPTEPGGTAG